MDRMPFRAAAPPMNQQAARFMHYLGFSPEETALFQAATAKGYDPGRAADAIANEKAAESYAWQQANRIPDGRGGWRTPAADPRTRSIVEQNLDAAAAAGMSVPDRPFFVPDFAGGGFSGGGGGGGVGDRRSVRTSQAEAPSAGTVVGTASAPRGGTVLERFLWANNPGNPERQKRFATAREQNRSASGIGVGTVNGREVFVPEEGRGGEFRGAMRGLGLSGNNAVDVGTVAGRVDQMRRAGQTIPDVPLAEVQAGREAQARARAEQDFARKRALEEQAYRRDRTDRIEDDARAQRYKLEGQDRQQQHALQTARINAESKTNQQAQALQSSWQRFQKAKSAAESMADTLEQQTTAQGGEPGTIQDPQTFQVWKREDWVKFKMGQGGWPDPYAIQAPADLAPFLGMDGYDTGAEVPAPAPADGARDEAGNPTLDADDQAAVAGYVRSGSYSSIRSQIPPEALAAADAYARSQGWNGR